ncbi:hypothetical protein MMC09_004545 [Bachmanniomyces sp. S44760]|nr:hypothetical protein [Bachmanniomyces sp. S44760]
MTSSSATSSVVDPAIFGYLQAKIDEESQVREELRNIVQTLEKQGRNAQSVLSRAHSTPSSELDGVVKDAEQIIEHHVSGMKELDRIASQYPYYKYNGIWSREVQTACSVVLFWGWLSGDGKLLTIEDVGQTLGVPVNLKDRDAFHISIEEYLHALISLIDELVRLAINSVTLGNYERPMQISRFVKDVHAGFQILNLKNDALRRRSDSIKYSVKKIEDVVYDLSLRNLVPSGKP